MSSGVRTIQTPNFSFQRSSTPMPYSFGKAGLELLRRLVEHVREHEAAGRRQRGGRRRRERAPGQAHPGAAGQQRRRVVGIARRAPASRPQGWSPPPWRPRRRRTPRSSSCRRGREPAPPAASAPRGGARGRRWCRRRQPEPPGRGVADGDAAGLCRGTVLGAGVSGFVSSAIVPRSYPITFSASSAACRTFRLRSCWLNCFDRRPERWRPSAPPPPAAR